jgi:hypothetical protein
MSSCLATIFNAEGTYCLTKVTDEIQWDGSPIRNTVMLPEL